MAKIVVTGGNVLNGEVNISGAKNAVLPILCATLLADAPVEITNVPHLHDVVTTTKLLAGLGAGITIDQVYRSPDLALVSRRLGEPTGSDHRPVVTEFRKALR